MEESKSTFNLAMKPALLTGGVSVLISLLLWALVDDMQTQQKFSYFTWLILAFMYFYFTKNYRENELDGNLSYGQGFKFMFVMSLIISIITALYSYVLFAYLDPSLIEAMKEQAAEQMYQQNLSDEQVEAALEMQSAWLTPGMMVFYSIFGSLFFGSILALIIALFTKKEVVTFED